MNVIMQSGMIQARDAPPPPTPPTFEGLTSTISGNLSQAESILYRLRERLIGNAPQAQGPTANANSLKEPNEPTVESRLQEFAERTFQLAQELGTVLGRVTP